MSQPAGNEVPDTLAALDWHAVTCQSAAGCTNRATHVAHVHAVDRCNGPLLDPFGDVIEILCSACLWRVEAEIRLRLGRLGRGSGAYCLACGAPVSEPGDVMRDIVEL